MKHNLSVTGILVRYLIGIYGVIASVLIGSLPLAVVAMAVVFTGICGWFNVFGPKKASPSKPRSQMSLHVSDQRSRHAA